MCLSLHAHVCRRTQVQRDAGAHTSRHTHTCTQRWNTAPQASPSVGIWSRAELAPGGASPPGRESRSATWKQRPEPSLKRCTEPSGEGLAGDTLGCLLVCCHMLLVGGEQEDQEVEGQLIKGVRRALRRINRVARLGSVHSPQDTFHPPLSQYSPRGRGPFTCLNGWKN